jgi:hypothetical protein
MCVHVLPVGIPVTPSFRFVPLPTSTSAVATTLGRTMKVKKCHGECQGRILTFGLEARLCRASRPLYRRADRHALRQQDSSTLNPELVRVHGLCAFVHRHSFAFAAEADAMTCGSIGIAGDEAL